MTGPETTVAPARSAQQKDRERFVAFAFCWADVLLEIDRDGTIVYAAGTTSTFTGKTPDKVIGATFVDLVADPDKALARELVAVAAKRGRIDDATIRLTGPNGATSPLALAGYRLDDFNSHYFFALRSTGATAAGPDGRKLQRDQMSGLYAGEDFASLAARRLKAAGDNAELTLISMPEMAALRDRLDEDTRKTLAGTLGAALRANSFGGDSATEIADGRYAIVHESGIDARALEAHLTQVTREIDPDGKGVAAEAATVDVKDGGLTDEDLANGLVHVINQFRESKGSDFSLTNFASNLNAMVDQATKTMQGFRKVLGEASFDIAFHPIVDVKGGRVHHYEALVRFQDAPPDESPFKMITFAEDVGLIWHFDLAMARKVVEWLQPRRANKYKIAVNISGQSIANPSYHAELFALLEANPWTSENMLFEITESARIADLTDANHFFQTLRGKGYEVCLDDFGAGAASFQYLASLDVDVVKLDGSAVKNALAAKKGRAFLTALTKLCKDIGVETVAEMVDDQETLNFVRDCGVDFAQGYLFGKPSIDITVFAKTGLPRIGR
ncbi:MAG: diguanylate phosphodiesterase [Rhodospirillales bacterium]|nr:diguanylate phosphodiesterase [Rhodospirillales bacterium]